MLALWEDTRDWKQQRKELAVIFIEKGLKADCLYRKKRKTY